MYEIKIKKSTEEDFARLAEISRSSMTSSWNEKNFEDAFSNSSCEIFTAFIDGETAGYAVIYFAADESELPSIAVDEKYRCHSIGTSLLNAAVTSAKSHGAQKMFLEVRASNEAAHGLYEKKGFLTIGTRKHFYDNPTEDADVMMLDIL